VAAFTDSEAETDFDSNRSDEFDIHFDVVARHTHFDAVREFGNACNVRCTEIELRTIVIEERSVATALVLGKDVDLTAELGKGLNGTGFSKNLTAFDLCLSDAAEQAARVVTGLDEIEDFVEHFHRGDDGFLGITDTDDFDFVAGLELTALDTTRNDSTTTCDGENVFDRHDEGLIGGAFRGFDIFVNSVHKLEDASILRGVEVLAFALESCKSGTADNGGIIAREVVLREKLTDFHFDEFEEFGVVNLVNLVKEDNDIRDTDLTSEQDVLTGLSHRTVGSSDNEDSTVHLCSTCNHVFDIVGVTRAVNVSVVASISLILYVSGVNRDTASTLLRSLINLVISHEVSLSGVLHSEGLSNSRSKSGLTVVDVTDGTDINVRFSALEFLFCHLVFPPKSSPNSVVPFYTKHRSLSSIFCLVEKAVKLVFRFVCNELFLQALGKLDIVRGFHSVAPATLSFTAEVCGVAEHF